jgi:hypothetical protein
MERASGVYRRNAKGVSIMIGFFLAVAINANSIHILDQLAFEEELRQTLSGSASQFLIEAAQQAPAADTENADRADVGELLDNFREDIAPTLDNLNLPIGWDPYLIDAEFNCGLAAAEAQQTTSPNRDALALIDPPTATQPIPDPLTAVSGDLYQWERLIELCLSHTKGLEKQSGQSPAAQTIQSSNADLEVDSNVVGPYFYPTAIASIFLQRPLVGLRYVLGWMITGIAISMGASFWFDLLSKLVNVRNTGKPIPTGEEGAESPKSRTAARDTAKD